MSENRKVQGFKSLPLAPSLQDRISRLGFVTPTPIQAAAIPVALRGRDLIGIAQTGTGKTLAFVLPIINRLRSGRIALVLAPTRELAMQIEEQFRKFDWPCALLIGGAAMGPQLQQLRKSPRVIIATPGRLEDHLAQRTVSLQNLDVLVLDEADRMLDMGFIPAIRRIVGRLSRERQTMLFSATMPSEIEDLAQQFLSEPKIVHADPPGTTAKVIAQELVVVPHAEKGALLNDLLAEHRGSILVFARTRHGARKLARNINRSGHKAAEIHSDRTQAQRKAALSGFKSGTYRILVATDIASRGIDVKDISLVINYDVPERPEDYVHRIGRTGRAGATGLAITLATPEQQSELIAIERHIKEELKLSRKSQPRPAAPSHRRGQVFRPSGAGRRRMLA